MTASATQRAGFCEAHGDWSAEQRAAAERLLSEPLGVDFVRVGFGDPHGLLRTKVLTVPAFRGALRDGLDMSPGPLIFDTGHALPNDIFASGAGLGLDELTGAGDFVVVPDPLTFRTIDAGGVPTGVVLGDEHLRDGTPHPLSSRGVLRRLLRRLAESDRRLVVGVEVEFYVLRLLDPDDRGAVGGFGVQGAAPKVATVNAGYQFNSDLLIADLLPLLAPICRTVVDGLGMPLRTIEHESGPGQLEITFAPMDALAAADSLLLLRGVLKQACLREGHLASFMSLPGVPGADPSGWHLHQSLTDHAGANLFVPDGDAVLGDLGLAYVAGLLDHGAAGAALAIPTVNGYRRLDPVNTLSPDRLAWSHENRGALVRALGGPGDASTHVENRIGEPTANPYLYVASQCAAGLDGIERGAVPPPPVTDPHDPAGDPLPHDLGEALALLRSSALFRELLGDALMDNLLALKQSEWDRYQAWRADEGPGEGVSRWESDEYLMAY